MRVLIAIISTITGLSVLALFAYFEHVTTLPHARTIAFAALGTNSLFYVFSVRSLKQSLLQQKFFSNKWLVVGVALGLVIQFSALYFPPLSRFLNFVPLGFMEWAVIGIEVLFVIILIEIIKFWYSSKTKNVHKTPLLT